MRNLHLILALATSLLPLATAQAAPADVPKSGQITCFNDSGAVIACADTGQDGAHRAGATWPNPRFTTGTGAAASCLTDNLTGLMWMRAPSTLANTPNTWTNALAITDGLTLCGFSDWRLPNVNELESLANSEAADPAAFLHTQGFSGVQQGIYWSSSTSAGNAARAWIADIVDGFDVHTHLKSDSYYVWPVRGGQ